MIRHAVKSFIYALPVLTSCGLTGWILDQVVITALLTPRHPPRHFTLEMSAYHAEDGPAPPDERWLWRIVADGRLLNLEASEHTGQWEQAEDSTLIHRHQAGPASVSFPARNAVLQLLHAPTSGRATLQSADTMLDTVTLTPAGPAPRRVLSVPPSPPHRWTLGVAISLLLAGACGLHPWQHARQERYWFSAYLLAIHLAVWVAFWIGTNNDTPGYAHTWQLNVAGEPFYFPPGYGGFLRLADTVPILGKGSAATLLQHLMMIATLLWLHRLLTRLVPRPIAAGWLVLTSVLPPSLFMPQMILSENLALFAMAAALYFATRAAASTGRTPVLLAGLSLALGILARVVPVVVAPALLLMQHDTQPLKRVLRRGGAILAVATCVTLLPAGWFALHGRAFALTSSTGRHLFNRAVFAQKLLDPQGPVTARLQALLPDIDLRHEYHWSVATRLIPHGFPIVTARGTFNGAVDQLLEGTAWEAIRSQPVAFFRFSFTLAWRNLFGNPCGDIRWFAAEYRPPPVDPDTRVPPPDLEDPRPLQTTTDAIDLRVVLDRLFVQVWVPLCWLAVAGALGAAWASQRTWALALAWIPTGYLLACGFVEFFLPRYTVAVMPFVTATAMLPFGLIAAWLTRQERAR